MQTEVHWLQFHKVLHEIDTGVIDADTIKPWLHRNMNREHKKRGMPGLGPGLSGSLARWSPVLNLHPVPLFGILPTAFRQIPLGCASRVGHVLDIKLVLLGWVGGGRVVADAM